MARSFSGAAEVQKGSQALDPSPTGKDDEVVDGWVVSDELVRNRLNHPCDSALRPSALEGVRDRQHVYGIPERREHYDAYFPGRWP